MSRALSDHLAVTSSLQRQGARPDGAIEGVVVAGSWDPTQGTVQVVVGDTYAIFPDTGDQYVPITARLATPFYGAQYGPQGGERALLVRTQSGWTALLEYDGDDSPHAASGETLIGALGTPSILMTKGGHIVRLDDVAKTIAITTKGGLEVLLDDNAGTVSVGGTGLTSANGVERQQDVVKALTDFKAAMVTAGVPAAGSIVIPTVQSSTTVLAK